MNKRKNLNLSLERGNKATNTRSILTVLAISFSLVISPALIFPAQAQIRDLPDYIPGPSPPRIPVFECNPPQICPSPPLPKIPKELEVVPPAIKCIAEAVDCIKNLANCSSPPCNDLIDHLDEITPPLEFPPVLPETPDPDPSPENPCSTSGGTSAACICYLSGGTSDFCIDSDKDGIANLEDNCPEKANPDQKDTDGDGVGDVCEETETEN